MLWFGSLYRFLNHESERCSFNALKLAINLVNIPVFETHHLFFKVSYKLGLFHLDRISRRGMLQGSDKGSVNFGDLFRDLSLNVSTDVERQQFLREAGRRLDVFNNRSEGEGIIRRD